MKPSLIAAALVVCSGCAQIDSRSTIVVTPRPELEPKWLGEAKTVVGRALSMSWSQSLSTVELQIEEARTCRAVLHAPVDRVESIDRTVKHGALYVEYGVGATILAVGLAALIKPEAFAPQAVTANGTPGRDTTTGYRLGGIFTALGAGLIGIGAYDTARSRDTVTTTRAYRMTTGDMTPCISPNGPRAGLKVELVIGPWTAKGTTDIDGKVHFGLPGESELGIVLPPPREPAPEPDVTEDAASEPGDPPPSDDAPVALGGETTPTAPLEIETTATVRVEGRAGSFVVIAPLSSPAARGRSGTAELRPSGPPRPTATQ